MEEPPPSFLARTMKTVTLKPEHSAYLERTARDLSAKAGKKVSKRAVLHLILDIAINDEAMYDPSTDAPLDPYRKEFVQGEKEARTASFDVQGLFDALSAI